MLDWGTIIVGALAFCGTALTSYFTNNKTTALITYRLQQLEDKVNKHNNVVERTALIERDLKAVWRNIDELKAHEHEG